MKTPSLANIRGTVHIVLLGGDIEAMINEMAVHGLNVWEIKAMSNRSASMNILVNDFFKLRPLLKRTGCRVRVKQRIGFPFFTARVMKRKLFITGALLFFILLFTMSSLVWDVEVKGNVKMTEEEILAVARKEGLYPFQLSFRLPEQDKLAKDMVQQLPAASWIGVMREGTKVTIQVVEADEPEKKPLMSPRHLISKTDAVITEIYAEQGRPVVQKDKRVKKGDILISGILGDEENTQNVVAKGEVKGLVWHEYNIEVPLVQKQVTYTGELKERRFLVLGNRAIQFWGYGDSPYTKFETITEVDPLTWRSFKLPVGWMTEIDRETVYKERTPGDEIVKQQGLEAARNDILAKNGKGTKVISEKILHEKKENGKVYMKVLFEVEESIAVELPLVYNQVDDQGE
ncbi:sporulation protein YqfD [Paenibacillus sp. Marseille-Q4541]|uniref:sporulation protein YqfD n=1 Tax=Paenibacillus sp. Marseille-Q4541 TaxID=2831522 RepID=UPI001BAD020F